jgi:cell wall-associated NlpC family hydrolase
MSVVCRLALLALCCLLLGGCAFSVTGSQPALPPPATGTVMETARALIGVPYRAAGQSPQDGFDCSGFVQWVYARHGIRLPRRTQDQLMAGQPVPKEALRAGDLVFFTPSGRFSSLHVGIFDGHGGFIHSPSPGGRVRQETIQAPYWKSSYYAANRVTR